MSAHEIAMMSVWSAPASVGSETMKIRVATPVRNWPMIAFARRSRSVRAITRDIVYRRASAGGAPAPRRPAARTTIPARPRAVGVRLPGHERRDSQDARDAGTQLGTLGAERPDRHLELHHAGRDR